MMTIYFIIALLWAIGIHAYAITKLGAFDGFEIGKKIYRGLIGLGFQTVLFPVAMPLTVYKLIKKLPISLTTLSFKGIFNF